jgi:hypothetical protein
MKLNASWITKQDPKLKIQKQLKRSGHPRTTYLICLLSIVTTASLAMLVAS